MNIHSEEIHCLLRVVAESLRKSWEKKHLHGQSLIEIAKTRNQAIAAVTQRKNKMRQWQKWIVTCAIISSVIGVAYSFFVHSKWLPAFVCFPYVLMLVIILILDDQMKSENMRLASEIQVCTEKLELFRRSVDRLNPLGVGNPYFDFIDAEEIDSRAVMLAERILEAKDKFEGYIDLKGTPASQITNAGKWIHHCEEMFANFCRTSLDDFEHRVANRVAFEEARVCFEKSMGRKPRQR